LPYHLRFAPQTVSHLNALAAVQQKRVMESVKAQLLLLEDKAVVEVVAIGEKNRELRIAGKVVKL